VTVRNVGDRAGTEITQLYLNDLFTKLSTPTKTLKRFARTTLKPGDSTRLRFELRTADLTYVGLGGEPVLEPGEFELMVGGSSQDDHLLTARFSVAD
jgi:beta-glucosidase